MKFKQTKTDGRKIICKEPPNLLGNKIDKCWFSSLPYIIFVLSNK
jgi:hypothetical protein